MKKLESIKRAYGEIWESVKEFIDENGWLKFRVVGHGVNYGVGPEVFSESMEHYEYKSMNQGLNDWRPATLRGIEDNHGWHSIEEEGFPTESGWYFLSGGNETIAIAPLHVETGIEYIKSICTHWQLIKHPEKPIY